ncbi:MAG: hypothetical protein AABW63_00340 [Nanoarchaeota archaeon]
MEEESIPQLQTKLSSTSQGFRKYFLLLFTKELIKQTKVEEFFTLNHVIKKKNKEVEEIENLRKEIEEAEKEKIRTGVFRPQRVLTPVKTYTAMQLPPQKQEEQFIPSLMHTEKPLVKQYTQPLPEQITQTLSQQPQVQQRTPMPRAPRIPPPLIIPEYPLPPTVQYLRPYPTNIQVDLGKLNILVNDQNVRAIECNGPEEPIVVRGGMGAKNTNIVLNEEEVNDVLRKFSEASRIPISEGIFKIVVGKLILSAIVSEVVGSKFIIRKMAPPSPFGNMPGMYGF